MPAPLTLDVYVAPYIPIHTALPSWDAARQATWPASSVSLISAEDEAVLIDALITDAEAANVEGGGRRLAAARQRAPIQYLITITTS